MYIIDGFVKRRFARQACLGPAIRHPEADSRLSPAGGHGRGRALGPADPARRPGLSHPPEAVRCAASDRRSRAGARRGSRPPTVRADQGIDHARDDRGRDTERRHDEKNGHVCLEGTPSREGSTVSMTARARRRTLPIWGRAAELPVKPREVSGHRRGGGRRARRLGPHPAVRRGRLPAAIHDSGRRVSRSRRAPQLGSPGRPPAS